MLIIQPLMSQNMSNGCTDVVHHLLAPGRLEALEFLHIASIEGVKCINEPLFVCVPQGLQHRMHQLQRQSRGGGRQQAERLGSIDKQHRMSAVFSGNPTSSPKL